MKNGMRVAVLLAVALAIGCGQQTTDTITRKFDNVVRVFMREPGIYVLGVKQPGSAELKMIHFGSQWSAAKLLEDVPAMEPMWAEETITYMNDGCGTHTTHGYVIHIHSEKSVEGGGWNHGKFGSGNNQVIK